MSEAATSGWVASFVRLADSLPLELTAWWIELPPPVLPMAVMPALVMVGKGSRPPHSSFQTRAHPSGTTVKLPVSLQ